MDDWKPLAQALGARIRELRAELGFTQEDLADAAGLHRTYVADVERGNRNPSLGSIGRIAQGLGCDLRDLFPALTRGSAVRK